MALHMLEELRFTSGLDPVADFGAGGVSSDVIDMSGHNKAFFVIHRGVGATGTGVLTIEACDDVTPTNTTVAPAMIELVTITPVCSMTTLTVSLTRTALSVSMSCKPAPERAPTVSATVSA